MSADGTLYIASCEGGVFALSCDTGAPRWPFPFDARAPVVGSPALGADGTVYVGGGDGVLHALDGVSGGQKWLFDTGGGVSSQIQASINVGPTGVVFFGSGAGAVFAVSAAGDLVWRADVSDTVSSTPALSPDGTVLVVGLWDDHHVAALNASTGAVLWKHLASGPFWSSPSIADGLVFIGCVDNALLALDLASGALKWSFATGDEVRTSPAVANGTVVFGDFTGKLYGVDARAGKQRWVFEATPGQWIQSSPAVGSDGTVYVASEDAFFYALDVNTGAQRGLFSVGAPVVSSPAIGLNRTVFFADAGGVVYALM